jgi:putative hydrolase of HD superfamily
MYDEIIEFVKLIGRLKKIERTGWITWKGLNIKNPESVAEHIFRSAVLGMIIGDLKKLDTEKIVRMILLHDLAECIIGDWSLTAKKKLGTEKWKQREKEAMEKILSLLPQDIRKKYEELWEDFENRKSEEAKIAFQVEKLEMIFQALEYMEEGYDKEKLKDFFIYDEKNIEDKDLREIFMILDSKRKKI